MPTGERDEAGQFGVLLRERRLQLGLTQDELAARSGVSSRSIRALESGGRQPRMSSVAQLADALGLDAGTHVQWLTAARGGKSNDVAPPEEVGTRRVETTDTARSTASTATYQVGHIPKRWRAAWRILLLALLAVMTVLTADGSPVASNGTVAPSTTGRSAYVARISSDDNSIGTPSSTGADLQVLHAVAPGDALVVTVALTDTQPGMVEVTDSAGNHYEAAADTGTLVNRDRLMTFVVVGAKSLDTLSKITIRWPWSSDDHVAVDEFRGIDTAGSSTEESSTDHGTGTFTVSDPPPCAEGDLMFAAVSARTTGPAPELEIGWTPLAGIQPPPGLQQPNYQSLATGYRFVSAGDKCTMRVTTPEPWQAVILHLR